MNKDYKKIKKFRIRITRLVAVVLMIAFIFGEQKYRLSNLSTVLINVVGLLLCIAATLGRTWCSFYISGFKNKKVISEGPYSTSRNPLYLL